MLPIHVRHEAEDPYATLTALFDSGSPVHFVSSSFAVAAGIDPNGPYDMTITVQGIGPGQDVRPGFYVDALTLDLGGGRAGDQFVISNTAVFVIPDEAMPGDLDAILGNGAFSPSSELVDTTLSDWYVDTRDGENACIVLVGPEVTPGDCDQDGDVDINDLSALAAAWGTTAGAQWDDGDFDLDGDVDINDLSALATNWGVGTAGGMSLGEAMADVAIPEPATLAVLLIGAATLLAPRRLRR